MIRILTVCTCAMVTVLVLSSDASAQCPNGYVVTYYSPGISYGGYAPSYSYTPTYYAPSYGYATSYYTPSYSYAPSYYVPSYSYAPTYYTPSYSYTPSYGYATSYYTPSYYTPSYGYNPGGLGGPWSGLGVRPGVGFGGFGVRR